MFKFIILSIIGFYILFKIVGFLFRTLISMSGNPQRTAYQQPNFSQANSKKKAPDSNLDIDYIPNEKKAKAEFKGGEYVDYEEVK